MPRTLTMANVLVHFTRSMTPYMAGERAGFSPEKAKIICDKGYAVQVAPTGAEAETPDPITPDDDVAALNKRPKAGLRAGK